GSLCALGVPLLNSPVLGDQVDQHADVRQHDDEHDPRRLRPTGLVVPPEDVGEHGDEKPEPDHPRKEQEHVPEEIEKRETRGNHVDTSYRSERWILGDPWYEDRRECSMADSTRPDLEPIGVVRSTLRRRKNAPRSPADGAPEAILEIDERFAAALEGVRPGMELIAVTWLHEGVRDVLQVHPGRDNSRPLTGVFATRSPDRPNPIGLHRVTVKSIEPPRSVHV